MNGFDLKNVVNDIVELEQKSNFEQYIEIFLIVTKDKVNDLYKQESDDNTKKVLFESLKNELNNSRFLNREVISYDAVLSKKNTHELVDVKDFENISRILDEFNDTSKHLTSTNGMNESKFHLYMISFRTDAHSYKVIGKFSNVLELKKKILFGNFSDSKIKVTDSNNIVGFNKKIDLLIVDNEYVLINQSAAKFESLFKMKTLFSSQALNILDNSTNISSVFTEESIARLRDKVQSGKRMATRLIKITSDEDRFNKTINNIDKIDSILKDDTHPFYEKVKYVTYSNGKLSVTEGQEVQLLNAISDAFYHAIFSETDNVDESRM